MRKQPRSEAGTTLDAVKEALRSDAVHQDLSSEETAILAGQLTDLVSRMDRVRALGPAFAGVSVSEDVRELLARMEMGSSLVSGVH